VARAVAQALSCRHVDTGAMYRAVAWLAVERGVALDDEAAVAEVARAAAFDLDGGRVGIDGHDVTAAIRTADMDQAAARVARLPAVRRVLLQRQRTYAEAGAVVMEGRDIGTVVLPEADVKFFLDASAEERARRRASDAAHTSRGTDVGTVAQALRTRDEADRTRPTSPLARAADAIYIDTTALPVEAVVAQVLDVIARVRAGR
jgi:cytidylate kinase